MVRPDAPWARCFPATRASAAASRRAPTASCRASGSRGIPTGAGVWSVRASYGLFYDQFQNGVGHRVAGGDQLHAVGAVQPVQRRGPQLPESRIRGARYPAPNTFVRPSTVFTIDADGEAAVRAGLERRACSARCSTSTCSRSATWRRRASSSRGTSRTTRPCTAPARRHRTPTGGASTRTARPTAAPAISRRSRCCATSRTRTIKPGQVSLSRRYRAAWGSTSRTGSRAR